MRDLRKWGGVSAAAVTGGLVAALATAAIARGGATPAAPATDPCVEAWAHQQLATPFVATAAPARSLATFQSLLAAGTLPTGLCLKTHTELYDAGWAVTSVAITARGPGQDGQPIDFTRTGTDESEDLNPLYVPLSGCVRVTGTITATRRHASPLGGSDRATWVATGVYGRGCAQAPGHGAYPGDDGMLAR